MRKVKPALQRGWENVSLRGRADCHEQVYSLSRFMVFAWSADEADMCENVIFFFFVPYKCGS